MKDSMSRYLTQSLFYEYKRTGIEAKFTLKDEDHVVKDKTYISMRRLYLNIADPTEYEFAVAVFKSWSHWKRLCGNAVLRVHIDRWREELEVKLRSEAIQTIKYISDDSANKSSLVASKWLADKGWEKKRGRPTKEEVTKERKIVAAVTDELDEDYNRIVKSKNEPTLQ